MKTIIVFGVLCLAVTVFSRKPEENIKENIDDPWSSISEHSEQHQAKKYKDPKKHHHHHSKYEKSLDSSEYKHPHHEKVEGKKGKHISKQAPHEIPPQEAEIQANLHTSRKHVKDQHAVDAKQDLHLQDLAYEESLKKEEAKSKSPHQYQRGQHKSDHFSESKILDDQTSPEVEKKLFADSNVKERHDKPSHPILEDSFETLQDKKMKKDTKHGKKYNKHKKSAEKSKNKKDKKSKSSKKEKKNKKEKEKKYKKW